MGEPIAVVGLWCRFPGAPDPAAYWDLLRNGVDAIREIPADRWDADAYFDPRPSTPGRMSTRWGGFLDDVRAFDAEFFGISPREAQSMDPQQRLALEVAWHALEDAGQPADRLAGTLTGVFMGVTTADYALLHDVNRDLSRINPYYGSGTALGFTAGRLSYVLGLEGPSFVVDTACSSSLVAIHLACQSLRNGECDMAIAGGVNLVLSPVGGVYVSQVGAVAPDGRCKTFDASANGYVRSEGCGIVVLKRYRDAVAAHDRVRARILGSAINQDGRSAGLTVPNGSAQQKVINRALASAAIEPASIDYVEAHGTGTALGDPIELRALGSVFAGDREGERPLLVGSVKSNIGHLESAAGVAGLIKVILSLEHRAIPQTLHIQEPTPHVDWRELRLDVPRTLTSWPEASRPRRAGLSSFGFSGTNAHVVVEEGAGEEAWGSGGGERGAEVLVWSGRSAEAVAALGARYGAWLRGAERARVRAVCAAASQRRSGHAYRAAVVGETAAAVAAAAEAVEARGVRRARARQVAFVYSGQGGQWGGMGQELWESSAVFRAAVTACDAALERVTGRSVARALAAGVEDEGDVIGTQAALFAVQVGLTAVWASWGVRPAAVVGHSMGEVAAGWAAGVLPLGVASEVLGRRAAVLAGAQGSGSMLAVGLSAAAAARVSAAQAGVSVAAVNGPQATVLSGESEGLRRVAGALEATGVEVQWLRTSGVAGHSPAVAAAASELTRQLAGWRGQRAQVPWVSTVTGAVVAGETLEAAYWGATVAAPVQFAAAVTTLAGLGCDTVVEVGAHPVLSGVVSEQLEAAGAEACVVGSLRRTAPARATLLRSLATLYTAGVPVDWGALYPPPVPAVSLPPYPFQRSRHWLEQNASPAAPLYIEDEAHADPHVRLSLAKLLREHPVEGARAINRPYLAPSVFLTASRGSFFYVSRTETSLTALLYVGPPQVHVTSVTELLEYARQHDLSANIFCTSAEADRLRSAGLSATICGALQSLQNLASFTLDGRRMRRLRYLVHRYAQSGYVEFAEYVPGTSAAVDEEILAIVDEWAATKKPVVFRDALADQFRRGAFPPWYRVFITRRDGRVEAAVILCPAGRGGYLLDVEFYRASITGVLDWTIVQIIDRLKEEGAAFLSFGGTFGAALHPHDGDTAEVFEFFTALRETGVLNGDANYQFKEKFRPVCSPLFLCRDRGTGTRGLNDVLRMLAGDRDASRETIVPVPADWARNHAIGATAVVPGALLVSLIASISRDVRGGTVGPTVIGNFAIHQPTSIDRDITLRARAIRGPQGARVTVHRVEPDPCGCPEVLLASATTRLREADVAEEGNRAFDLTSVRARCDCEMTGEQFYELLDGLGYRYDGAFRGVSHVYRGAGEVLARVEMHSASTDREEHRDAALLDACLQVFTVASEPRSAAGHIHVLRRITRIFLAAPLTPSVWAHARAVPSSASTLMAGDLQILDMHGNLIARLTGIEAVSMDMSAIAPDGEETHATEDRTATQSDVYERVWHPESASNRRSAPLATSWLLLADGTVGEAMARGVRERGGECTLWARRDGSVREDVAAWRARAGERAAVVHAWAMENATPAWDSATLEAASWWSAGSVVEVVQGLNDAGRDTRVWVVTDGGLGGAAAWGTGRVIAAEHPELWGGLIEVSSAEAGAVAEALERGPDGEERARLHGTWHVARLRRRAAVAASGQTLVRSDSTYVVTGGLGGVGLAVAGWLVAQGAGRVVLAGRREPGPEIVEQIERWRVCGTEVWTRAVDVTDEAAVRGLLAESGGGGLAVRGVVHASGLVNDAVVAREEWTHMRSVLAPKLLGGWHVHAASTCLSLDWFALFGSAAALLGPRGQAAYAAANAFLDALARYRRAEGLPAVTLDWGAWSQVGGATAAPVVERLAAHGIQPFSPAEALAHFAAALTDDTPQLAPMRVDWSHWSAARATVPMLRELVDHFSRPQPGPSGGVTSSLEAYLRDSVAKALGVSVDRLDPDRPFSEMGFDSLMCLELRSRIDRERGLKVPLAVVFKAGTLARLTQELSSRLSRTSHGRVSASVEAAHA